MPIPALAPVLRPLLDIGEGVAVGLWAGTLVVVASEEELEAIEVELADDIEEDAEAVKFGFCDVTVRLERTKRPCLFSQHGVAAVPVPVQYDPSAQRVMGISFADSGWVLRGAS